MAESARVRALEWLRELEAARQRDTGNGSGRRHDREARGEAAGETASRETNTFTPHFELSHFEFSSR